MKIHNSSLASIPARYKANNYNETQISKPEKKEDSSQKRSVLKLQSAIQIEESLETVNLQQISKPLQNPPVNSRINQALNAYIQENNQPLKNQHSELIAGIDFFV